MNELNIVTEILDVGEARARLPDVRAALEPLMDLTTKIRNARNRLSRIEIQSTQQEDADRARSELGALEHAWRAAIRRVNDLGAYVKDPAIGLIDFYTWIDGEVAFLCWHYGEEDITHWHGLDEGFAGRKPIDAHDAESTDG